MTSIELLNRLRRAVRLADVMQASGITPQMAASADEHDWATAAQAVREMGEDFNGTPSEETQKLAISLLQRREDWGKRLTR